MKKIIIFLTLFTLLCLFLSLQQECFALTANNNVMVTTGETLNTAFEVNILEAFKQNNINFNDYNLAYYFSYESYNSYYFYISDAQFSVQSNTIIYTTGQSTLSFTYSNGSWVYNQFYGAGANIGTYERDPNNRFYFTNDGLFMSLNVTNYSSDPNYLKIDVSQDEEEEDSGLLQGIKDFFLAVFIPNEEAFEDLQDNFSEKILSKFNIISISRNNVSYNNNDIYESAFHDELPVFDIFGYRFDSQMLYNYLHMPLDFGKLSHMRDNYTEWTQNVSTGGITLFDIISIMFGIGITTLNIVLYNKFFDKGD